MTKGISTKRCVRCSGTGWDSSGYNARKCAVCKGTGKFHKKGKYYGKGEWIAGDFSVNF